MVDLSSMRLEDVWYIVGLIATDGNLSPDKRHIIITSKDRKFLYDVRDALKIKIRVGRKGRGGSMEKIYSCLQIGDIQFYRFLESIGLTKRKSLTLGPLKVPHQYFIDFLRGVIDGDGNIQQWRHASNGNIQWSLRIVSGSPLFLPWIKEIISKIMHVEGKLHIVKAHGNRNGLHILKYGKFAAKIILRMCYYPDALALDRKLKTSLKCIQSKDGLSKYGQFVSTQARVAEWFTQRT